MPMPLDAGASARRVSCSLLCRYSAAAISLFACSQADAWVATQSQAMVPANSALVGALPAAQPLSIAVSLKLPDADAVKSLITSMHTPGNPAYGSKLAPGQFSALYAPSAAQAQQVADYLSSAGFTNVKIVAGRLLVTANGTAAAAQRAFDTSFNLYLVNGANVFSNAQTAQVPDALGGIVQSVLGLQNVARMHTLIRPKTKGDGGGITDPLLAVPLMPNQFPIAYNAQAVPTGANTAVAIFMEGDVSTVLTDLRADEAANNEPQVPVQVVETDTAGTDISGVDEWDLDSQSSSGIAGDFQQMIWYVPSTLDDAPLETAFMKWVDDDVAIVANASFAECENDAKTSGYLAASDTLLMQAVTQGQTLFTSSGDNGSACSSILGNGAPAAGQPYVTYAGSSPYAVAVGGTTLVVNSDFTYDEESTWIAAGGGTSVEELKPSWQDNFVSGTLDGLLASTYKGTPDVSMDASPDSGAEILVNNAPETVGGTSLASPLAMGVWARLESASGNTLTFAAPILYALEQNGLTAGDYSSNITGFHDITNGSNGLYEAKTGWDYTNGVGTFDICNTATLLSTSGAVYCSASGTTTGGSSGGTTGETSGGATSGGTTGGSTSGGTSGGSSSGGTSGGSTSGGTSGGSSSGGTSGGTTSGGSTSGGASSGGTTGGTTTGSTTGGGTTTGGTTTGGTSGGSTTTGGGTTGTVSTTTGSSTGGDGGHGGAFSWEILLALASSAGLRRRQSIVPKQ